MTQYRKRPVVIDAHQWFKNGDHPLDDIEILDAAGDGTPFPSEGKIVRYFRHPDVPGDTECKHCGDIMHNHGWIDTLEGGHNVCPGDYIITGIAGEHYPCKPDIFNATYDPVPELGDDKSEVIGEARYVDDNPYVPSTKPAGECTVHELIYELVNKCHRKEGNVAGVNFSQMRAYSPEDPSAEKMKFKAHGSTFTCIQILHNDDMEDGAYKVERTGGDTKDVVETEKVDERGWRGQDRRMG